LDQSDEAAQGLQATIAVNSEKIFRLQVDINRAQAALDQANSEIQQSFTDSLGSKLSTLEASLIESWGKPRLLKTISSKDLSHNYPWLAGAVGPEEMVQLNVAYDEVGNYCYLCAKPDPASDGGKPTHVRSPGSPSDFETQWLQKLLQSEGSVFR